MIGIENVNEYYTTHYLEAILAGDIKPHLERFAAADDQQSQPPWRQLNQLQQRFFRTLERLDTLRTADARVEAHTELNAELLTALGYALRPIHRQIDAGPIPLLAAFDRGDGEPLLWILPVAAGHGDDESLLSRALLPEQHLIVPDHAPGLDLHDLHEHAVEALITDAFKQQDPPRFVLALGYREWILADRAKWPEQRMLRFDFEELLGRRDQSALEAVTALLHRETLAPESGTSLVDTLDDSSHKHAYEVSEDLKYALQSSIERIANEAIRYRREISKQKVYGEEIDAQALAVECIRYMYRILFLLYVEARPGLGYAPMNSEAYRLGYSFERLRDLEMVELETDEARNGYTIDLSLRRLFDMVYRGAGARQAEDQVLFGADLGTVVGAHDGPSDHTTFRLTPLKSHLFDPERTPFLSTVKLSNHVLLDVVKAMSLSQPQGTKKPVRRGRISYATLGINQLGAVYEALLSFRGFFAEETLFEVKPAKADTPDPVKDPAYFVPERDLARYSEAERVFDEDGRLTTYPPGAFIYRMAGRDRQKSASYYTPEVLTRCLVKYALKELLENDDGTPKHARAEDLLELSICEPAMGSAAFLNEAINQLAERYLQRRQQELGQRIPHDEYADELQRVRMYLADNNVYGVDLNPVALELAETSLWLNAIFTRETAAGDPEVFVPWFGGQLCTGNSLVGAWRKVFTAAQVDPGRTHRESPWLDAVPTRIPLGADRPEGSVYHFLLPDRGMAVYGEGSEGKPIRDLCPDELATIAAWRKAQCAPLSTVDRRSLARLSDAVDRLWAKHVELLAAIRTRTTDPLEVYGHDHPLAGRPPTTTREKDRIWRAEMASEQVRASSPYRRLKLAMDYWCALWFWPMQQAHLLPDRDEWLTDLALLLDSDVLPDVGEGDEQRSLFAPTAQRDEARALVDELGCADVEKLIARWPRLQIVDELATRFRFHHWELEFADQIAEKGGFDLIIGNPPWVKLEWDEAAALSDFEPSIEVHHLNATETTRLRDEVTDRQIALDGYLDGYEEVIGLKSFLGAASNFGDLKGVQPNLYKGFLIVGWDLSSEAGICALITDKGLYDEKRAGSVRKAAYQRLRLHLRFRNQFRLFHLGEGDNNKEFELSVFGSRQLSPEFFACSFLLHPKTLDECFLHRGASVVPPIKDESGQWVIEGHSERIVPVRLAELKLFARLYGEAGTPSEEARLPSVYSLGLLRVLRALSSPHRRLSDMQSDFFPTEMWHETNRQRDGTIRAETRFPEFDSELLLSGPHFGMLNPFSKCPRSVCGSQNAYDPIDLTGMAPDYVPRTNFVPNCPASLYRERCPSVPWAAASPSLDFYRLVHRRMINQPGERTMVVAICPPGVGHIHTVISTAFKDLNVLLNASAVMSSVPFDFFVKTTGKGDFTSGNMGLVPLIDPKAGFGPSMRARVLLLTCLTEAFADLWNRCLPDSAGSERCARGWPGFRANRFSAIKREWDESQPERTGLGRRQLMLELDVMVAMALGLSLKDLRTVYRAQFPVMRQYEADTWYDQAGRIVFTNNARGLPGVGLSRTKARGGTDPCWNDVRHLSEEAGYSGDETVTQVVMDDTLPGGPREKTITYKAPWIRCNREHDYEVAWAHFANRFGGNAS